MRLRPLLLPSLFALASLPSSSASSPRPAVPLVARATPAPGTAPPAPPSPTEGLVERQAVAQAPAASSSSSSINIPQTAAAGGITYTNPPQTAAASYYKIAPSQPITFGWNFTSVLSFGTSLTVQAFCSANGNTYSLATLPATATAVTFDPYAAEQTGGLSWAMATYTLRVFDERGFGAGQTPGLMAPNSGLMWAMYRSQSYTPLSSWICAGCSGATEMMRSTTPLLVATLATLSAAALGGWYGVLAGADLR